MLTYNQAKVLIKDIGRGKLENIISRHGIEMVKAAVEVEVSPSYIEDAFAGVYESKDEFAQEQLFDLTADLPWYLKIDWQSTANTIMEDYDQENNFYFRRM